MPHPPLECHNLTKSFGKLSILHNVSLTVRAGQIMALLGPSGCGKTTTLRLIAGFDFPDSGSIAINGKTVAGPGVQIPAEERRVGMVFQEYALFPHLSVADNIAFGLNRKGRERQARIEEMLALVGMESLANRMPYELSGGQQQRIALARALAPEPTILLLDEPFSNLDAALRGQMRTEIRAILKRSGITCVFVTHDQEEALSLADEIAVMLEGRVAQVADPQRLYHAPASLEVAAFVGEANFVQGLAQGETAESALGVLKLEERARGTVTLLIRPEAITLTHDPDSNAKTVWREFYGHDQRIGVKLADGSLIVARLDARQSISIGEYVHVQVNVPVRAYPL